MGNNFVDFNTLGMHNFLGSSILKKLMLHIILHVFFLIKKKAKYPKFTIEGFRSWKRINNGERCYSHHTKAMLKWGGLKNASQHIDRVMNAQSSQHILQNRLRLQTSIEVVKWLAKQACAFRGHDESSKSSNSGNFIEMIKYSARMNKDIAEVVLENAPGNAKYTSSDIQKELLNIITNRVWQKNCEEIGEAKFCILLDEAQDESKKKINGYYSEVC